MQLDGHRVFAKHDPEFLSGDLVVLHAPVLAAHERLLVHPAQDGVRNDHVSTSPPSLA